MEQPLLPVEHNTAPPIPRWHWFALAAVMLTAAALRGYGLFWGYPLVWHCDENTLYGVALRLARQISQTGDLDPHFNVWGPLAIYLLLPAIWLFPALGQLDPGQAAMLAGRCLGLAADVASVGLIYLIGRRAHSSLAGLLGAALYAVTLIAVREAHFYTVDVLSVTAMLAYLLLCLKAAEGGRVRDFVWCGVALGVALSVKQSSLPIVPLGLVALAIVVTRRARHPGVDDLRSGHAVAVKVSIALAVLAVAAIVGHVLVGVLKTPILELGRAQMSVSLTPERLAQHEPIFFDHQLESIWYGLWRLSQQLALLISALAAVAVGSLLSCRTAPVWFAELGRHARQFWAFAAASCGVFALLNPYALLRPVEYWTPSGPFSLTWGIIQVSGYLQPPPGWALQFVNTQPYLYQLQHILPYALGWPLVVAVAVALVLWALGGGACGKGRGDTLVWVAGLLLAVGVGHMWMKMTRYALPLAPLVALLAGIWLASAIRAPGWRRWAGISAAALGLAGGLVWCVAYLNVYAHPDNRAEAVAYVRAHLPAGSRVLVEDDDTWGAVGLGQLQDIPGVRTNVMDSYFLELDYLGGVMPPEQRAEKRRYLDQALAGADYVLLTGLRRERVRGLPKEFAALNTFYQQVFDNPQSWRQVGVWNTGPQLGRTRIDDSGAEPTFRLFDHPDVYLFERVNER